RSPRAYLENATRGQRTRGDETIPARELPFEFMLNALRLNDGVAPVDFSTRTGLPLEAIEAPLHIARTRGWLLDDPARIQATPLGRRFLNDVIEAFLPEPDSRRGHG
ncbi:MAG TPA: oxygen-independent coproporphyrinogen III oxidase-like protein, partial [Rhodanobacteraceae bacterium]|nr:oxygen-independent coproporphyrinogen III oxidase-like protein [Rhodanobacteraceae bacterium]